MPPMKRLRTLALCCLLVPLAACAVAPAVETPGTALDRPLPVDPNVRFYTLDNGLELWVRPHATPPDRVGLWLHVSTGSINEREDEHGLAHFLEHLAFNGSEHFPPGELVEYFESIGMTFGAHQNAFTSYDQTTYTLTLPDTEEATLRKGLLCLSDYAFRLSLLPEEIEKERGVILEEFRARKGPYERLLEKLLPILLPGSRAARRRPIGKEEVVRQLEREDFVGYYGRWYRPDNAVLLVVGEVQPEKVAELAAEHFRDWPSTDDPPANHGPGIEPYDRTRAAVLTDPELTTADTGAITVRPRRELKTVGDFRRLLVDELGIWIVNRRLHEMVQRGKAPFQSAEVSQFQLWNVCTYAEAEASGQPDRWRPMLEAVLLELKRAREHGFLDQELEDARRATIASSEQGARTEPTRDASWFLSAMNGSVSEERRPMSATQRLELIQSLIGGVELDEVERAFRANFDPEGRLLLVTMPEKEDLPVPPEDDLLALAEQAERTAVEPPAEKERAEGLLAAEPEPGAVVQQREEPDLEILSVTLSNGVRAHLRRMEFKKDTVLAEITVAGGPLKETARDRGVTHVATMAFRQPASRTLSSTQIRDLLTGKNVSLGAGTSRDAVNISISGTPEDVEQGFRLAHLLLTEPLLEESAFKRWREETEQEIERRKTSVEAHRTEQASALLSGGDVRLRFLTRQQADALEREKAQRWLEEEVLSAPIEVAVVGDIDRGRALDLVRKYFGSLPERPHPDAFLGALRRVEQNEGPLVSTVEVETITPRAVVLVGWRGADWTEVKDRRVLQVASMILTSRLRKEVREKRSLTYTIYCHAVAASSYPGTGLMAAYFTADPDKAAEAAELTLQVIRQLAEEGPTPEEMDIVHKQFRNLIETSQKEPGYWASVLADLDYHGTRLEDVKTAMEAYTSYTREDLLDVLGRYLTEERRLHVIVRPTAPSADEQPEGAAEPAAEPEG
jgi:zinc protease